MPVKIACPKCSKKYTLPDSALGKPVKCKACETTFRTKLPAGAAASPQPTTARPSNPARQSPAQKRPAQPRPAPRKPVQPAKPNPAEFGIDGGFQKQADIFGAPLQGGGGLENFAEQDPFGEADPIVVGKTKSTTSTANPFKSVMSNSSMRGKSARKKAGKKAGKKKQSKGTPANVTGYGVVRLGMMCVFGAGAAILLSSFASFAMSVLVHLVGSYSGGEPPQFLTVIFSIFSFAALGFTVFGSVVILIGHIMCMFAPQGNEKFNSIASGALAFFSAGGFVVMMLILGVSIANTTEAGVLAFARVGMLVVMMICGSLFIASTFLFINFYRRVGQNIKSDQLVKSSNIATIAAVGGLLLPPIAIGLIFLIKAIPMEPQVRVIIATTILAINALSSFGIGGLTLKMVWDGITSLKN